MYKCFHCRSEFADPKIIEFADPDTGSCQYREYKEQVCPYCGATEIEPMKKCVLCGGAFEESSIEISIRQDIADNDDECVCVKCMSSLAEKARSALKESLTDAEYNILSNYFDLSSKII